MVAGFLVSVAMRRIAAVATLVVALSAFPASASAAPFRLGLFDPVYLSNDSLLRNDWLTRTTNAGADVIRIWPTWASIAPKRLRAGFDASNPADPAYHWGVADAAIRDADRHGLQVLFTLGVAPTWAEGKHRSPLALLGTWKPDPAKLAAFAHAAAVRYSGTFPDPQTPGANLPRVRYWQVWNEPNLSTYLTPQWSWKSGHARPASPVHYRAMLNAAYEALHGVDSSNFVVTGGTAPYGDPIPGGGRMPPARFVRELLCLSGRKLSPERCPHPARLDALSHHPYPVGSPHRRALNVDDASVPDLAKLTRPLHAAERTGRVLPRGPKALWITEISYDGSPPDPQGVPEPRRARWLEDALFLLWRQGAQTVVWLLARDSAPIPSYATTYQSGLYFHNGRPKLSERAYRFPFVAVPRGRAAELWGRAPSAGVVVVQRRVGSKWRQVARLHTGASNVFHGRGRVSRGADLRAVIGGTSSVVWHLG